MGARFIIGPVTAVLWAASLVGPAKAQDATGPVPPPAGHAAAPADSGFRLQVQGVMPGMAPQTFADAVHAALPPDLLDPSGNFTRSAAYQADGQYRLVMVFHGEQGPAPDTLCPLTAAEAGAPADPPPFTALTSTTQVTAAFCQGADTLSAARDGMSGELTPDAPGFRFLVADMAKQLFPDGFTELPQRVPGVVVGR